MALHFPLYVNSTQIGYFYALRTDGGMEPDSINTYEIQIWKCRPLTEDDLPERVFTLTHRYGDGAWVLIQKALTEMNKDGT